MIVLFIQVIIIAMGKDRVIGSLPQAFLPGLRMSISQDYVISRGKVGQRNRPLYPVLSPPYLAVISEISAPVGL